MLSIEVPVNILFFLLLPPIFIWIGYKMRTGQVRRKEEEIDQLEKEMMNSHSEILDLQKEYALLESKLNGLEIPVIPIKTAIKLEEQQSEQFPDISMRKKLLLQQNTAQALNDTSPDQYHFEENMHRK